MPKKIPINNEQKAEFLDAILYFAKKTANLKTDFRGFLQAIAWLESLYVDFLLQCTKKRVEIDESMFSGGDGVGNLTSEIMDKITLLEELQLTEEERKALTPKKTSYNLALDWLSELLNETRKTPITNNVFYPMRMPPLALAVVAEKITTLTSTKTAEAASSSGKKHHASEEQKQTQDLTTECFSSTFHAYTALIAYLDATNNHQDKTPWEITYLIHIRQIFENIKLLHQKLKGAKAQLTPEEIREWIKIFPIWFDTEKTRDHADQVRNLHHALISTLQGSKPRPDDGFVQFSNMFLEHVLLCTPREKADSIRGGTVVPPVMGTLDGAPSNTNAQIEQPRLIRSCFVHYKPLISVNFTTTMAKTLTNGYRKNSQEKDEVARFQKAIDYTNVQKALREVKRDLADAIRRLPSANRENAFKYYLRKVAQLLNHVEEAHRLSSPASQTLISKDAIKATLGTLPNMALPNTEKKLLSDLIKNTTTEEGSVRWLQELFLEKVTEKSTESEAIPDSEIQKMQPLGKIFWQFLQAQKKPWTNDVLQTATTDFVPYCYVWHQSLVDSKSTHTVKLKHSAQDSEKFAFFWESNPSFSDWLRYHPKNAALYVAGILLGAPTIVGAFMVHSKFHGKYLQEQNAVTQGVKDMQQKQRQNSSTKKESQVSANNPLPSHHSPRFTMSSIQSKQPKQRITPNQEKTSAQLVAEIQKLAELRKAITATLQQLEAQQQAPRPSS